MQIEDTIKQALWGRVDGVRLPKAKEGRGTMILTKCAVCSTELGRTLGQKCGRCSTRYCGPACQKQHWEEGGHDQLCKKIKKAGGAEQYNANKKYTEVVSVAAEACAEDTKGQTCYICTQALHSKTKEGLVRMCACSGTSGFAHVSCLAEQAKILVAEAEENNKDPQWHRWHKCGLCEQDYYGIVRCALGWACWKTYLGRPETDGHRTAAISELGNGLLGIGQYDDALSVKETHLATLRRLDADKQNILDVQGNLAVTYATLERYELALRMKRIVYYGYLKLKGKEHKDTLISANNYADSLIQLERYKTVMDLLRETLPIARRVLDESDETMLRLRVNYARALCVVSADAVTGTSLDDLREAVTTLEESERTARRVFRGTRPEPRWRGAHPFVEQVEYFLRESRGLLHKKRKTEATPSPRNSTLS